MTDDKHVRKPNTIIQAGQCLSAVQQNILFSMLKRFAFLSDTTDIEELSTVSYRIPLNEIYPNFSTVKGGKTYELLRAQVSQLVEQKLTQIEGKSHRYIPLFGFAEVVDGAAHVEVQFNMRVLPYMINMIREGYTNLVFKEVYALKSAFAKRLYEMVYLNRNAPRTLSQGCFEISVEDFRFKLGIEENKHTRWFDFRSRIIEASQAEIHECTTLRFEVDYVIQKRVVVAIIFKDIHIVENVGLADGSIGEQGILDFTLDNSPVKVATNPLLEGLHPKDRESIEKKHSKEYVVYYYKKVKGIEMKGRLKSDFASCLFTFLTNDADDFYNRPIAAKKSASKKDSPEIERRLADRKKVQNQSERLADLEKEFSFLPAHIQQERIFAIKETMPLFSEEMARKQAILELAKEQNA